MKNSTFVAAGLGLFAAVAVIVLIQQMPDRPLLWHVLLAAVLLFCAVLLLPLALAGLGAYVVRAGWELAGAHHGARQVPEFVVPRAQLGLSPFAPEPAEPVVEYPHLSGDRSPDAAPVEEPQLVRRRSSPPVPVADGALPPPHAAPAGDGYEPPPAPAQTLLMPVVDEAALDAYHATAVASLAEPAPAPSARVRSSHRGPYDPDDVPPSQRVRDTAAAPWLPTAAVMVPTPAYGYDAMANARNASAAAT